MTRGRGKRLSPYFKARVALEAAKGHKTASEIAQEFQVDPTQISQWNWQLLDNAPELFESTAARSRRTPSAEEVAAPVYEEIGRLKGELNFFEAKVRPAQGLRRWLIGEQYLHTPFFGSRQMPHWLQHQSYRVNRKRSQRLMRLMALQEFVLGPLNSRPHLEHALCPYRLGSRALDNVTVERLWRTLKYDGI